MPRDLVQAPNHDRNRSLGWLAVRWMEHFCVHGPGDVQGEDVVFDTELTGFIVDCYAHSAKGRRLYDSAFFSRPKGRALALDTVVPTPSGWSTMGELQPGDEVYDRWAKPVEVLAVSEVMTGHQCFEIEFTERGGRSVRSEVIVADAEHLWTIDELLPPYQTVTVDTAHLASRPLTRVDGASTFRLRGHQNIYPTRYVSRVEEVESVPVRCITVDSPSSLFLVGEQFVPTHNSKSELAGFFVLFEAMGPSRFSGFATGGETYEWRDFTYEYEPGDPMGRPVVAPFIRCLATEETQPLALDTEVPTPTGWATIGDLDVGDQVFDESGEPVEISRTTEILRDLDCYAVEFSDGERIIASASHCWTMLNPSFEWVTMTTETLARRCCALYQLPPILPRFLAEGESTRPRWVVSVERVDSVPVRCIGLDTPSHLFLVGRRAIPTHNSGNTYDNVYFNLTEGPLSEGLRSDAAGLTRTFLPGGGEIRPSTSGNASKDGGKETFSVFDEALALDTPLPTPTGWTTMGEVAVGDQLLGANDEPVTVVKVTDTQLDRTCYRVTFEDQSSLVASSGHLWWTRPLGSSEPTRVRTTGEMLLDRRVFVVPSGNRSGPAWSIIRSIEPVDSVPVRCVAVDAEDHLFQAGPGRQVTHNTHLYVLPELRRMYATVRRNAAKRRAAAPWTLETSTMYQAGEDSVAEQTHHFAQLIKEGKARSSRLLFDHREAPPDVDLGDEEALREALREVYGPFFDVMDVDRIMAEIWDPRNTPTDSRRFFLNQKTAAGDAWIDEREWLACLRPEPVEDRETVVLGFDGSRKRARGVTDATALIGCRVSDGHLFEVAVWEQPDGPAGDTWEVPRGEVDRTIDQAFKRWNVVGFYADPAKWETYVAGWEARHGRSLKAKATHSHPIEWWIVGGRMNAVVRATSEFRDAVVDGELTHSGGYALTRHVLNARMRSGRLGITIAKEHPESPKKIDAAIAAMLAWQARKDAIAAGALTARQATTGYVPRRHR